MPLNYDDLLDDVLVALGDSDGSTWSRMNVIHRWVLEVIRTFPILRPMRMDYNDALLSVSTITMPADFREIISVEYPISQTPPTYLVRKSRFDPCFYDSPDYYDVDHDYATGIGWLLHLSTTVRAPNHVYIDYLANHDTDMTDSAECMVSIPEEYENIIIAQVQCRAYRELLGKLIQDPTAHTSVIQQYTNMCEHFEKVYKDLVISAQQRLANSQVSAHKQADKYDRVY